LGTSGLGKTTPFDLVGKVRKLFSQSLVTSSRAATKSSMSSREIFSVTAINM
jgi:ABC-type lipoprotein export system ATPase subunit